MKPDVRVPPSTKDWNLFFTDGYEGLYRCFSYFYDDFYRLGIHWYRDPDFVKECIHNLFLELSKIWDNRPDIENKRSYVLTIYKRVCYKTFVECTTGTPTVPPEAYELREPSYEDVLVASQTDEHLALRLQAALDQLTKRQKELIRLRYYEARPIPEIAKLLSLTERTVYNTLHSAVKLLREHLLFLLYLFAGFQ